jgi:hypothetical protein
MTALILITVLYIIPLLLMRRYWRLSHSDRGRHAGQDTGIAELTVTLVPAINIIGCFILWFQEYPIKRDPMTFNKFFGVKRDKK